MVTFLIQQIRRRLLDRMVLRPTRHPIEFAPKTRVVFDGPVGDLECFFQHSVSPQPGSPAENDELRSPDLIVLKFPGTQGRAERATSFPADALPGVHSEIWTCNPPGYGQSHGRASLRTLGASAVAFTNHVLDRHASLHGAEKPPTIWLTGNSLGCVLAMYVAAHKPQVNGIILRNPPPLIDVVKRAAARYPLGKWTAPIAESLCDTMNLMVTAPQVTCPAVLIQSLADELVPPMMQNEVVSAYSGEITIVPLAGVSHSGMPNASQTQAIHTAITELWQKTRIVGVPSS
ncbi:alpha/beta fold hydrolase [Stieleria varia]|uniref:Alpha/beta hydrolase family protein n=1 Tax=Stieleria varia TaxID=2528005 RepID=A0A5C6B7N4_9BACT|nr:alpha/beta hydrolase [Stieleria varia]TWU08083.1 Alpha/beta hydrolase family protein [Stieleria varia]